MPWLAELAHGVLQLVDPDAEQRIVSRLLVVQCAQFRRHEIRRGQRLTPDANTARDLDAHGTHEVAAPAFRAGVEQQLLPVAQVLRGDLAHEQAIEPAHGRQLATVHAAHQVHLVDRRVLRFMRRFEEMTGLGAHAAVDAGLQFHGRARIEIREDHFLGARHLLLGGQFEEVACVRQFVDPLFERVDRIDALIELMRALPGG